MEIDINSYLTAATDNVIKYAPNLLSAILVLFVGFWLIRKVSKLIEISLNTSSLSNEITSFLISLIDIVLKVAILLFAAGIAGFDTSALVGILAAAGFAVGLALQGGLGNFASGIIILVFKPYRVNDWIAIEDKFGKVEEIQIFNTILVTPGLKTLIIPNGQVTENIVTNFSKKGHIRLEIEVSMPYAESFPKVKGIIEEVLSNNTNVLPEPVPLVGIEKYDTHNIIIGVKPYVHPDEYWDATYAIHQAIKTAFFKNGVKMAYSEGVELGTIGE
ncbi:MAG: mechanosensitive ion channel [Spirosomaceae bacterium]|nr:mechanosensitive ion channel [Spirosomataceae bacterium]